MPEVYHTQKNTIKPGRRRRRRKKPSTLVVWEVTLIFMYSGGILGRTVCAKYYSFQDGNREDQLRGGDRGSSESAEGGQSWTRVVHGSLRGPSWTSHGITDGKIDELRSCFSKVLELLEAMMEDSCQQLENLAVFVRSLGWRVLADWVAKEVKMKIKL